MPREISTDLIQDDNFFENRSDFLEKRLAIVEWGTSAPDKREPRTKTEFARQLGVSTSTISNILDRADVQDEIRKRRQRILDQWDRDIFNSLVRSAQMDGKDGVGDRRLFFQLRGYLDSGSKISVEGKVTHEHQHRNMTDGDLVGILAEATREALGDDAPDRDTLEKSLLKYLEPSRQERKEEGYDWIGAVEDADYEVVEDENSRIPENSDDPAE